jgi:hypothetical protein
VHLLLLDVVIYVMDQYLLMRQIVVLFLLRVMVCTDELRMRDENRLADLHIINVFLVVMHDLVGMVVRVCV